METKTILVAEATIQESPYPKIQIKDELGLTYTIPKTKKDGNPTQAYLTQQALGDITGKYIEIGYDESDAPQGGKYRNIKIIKPAGEIKAGEIKESEPSIQEKISSGTPFPKDAEKPDWDEINLRKTADIHSQVAFKEARAHLSTQGVNLETHPERLDDLRHLFLGILDGKFKNKS